MTGIAVDRSRVRHAIAAKALLRLGVAVATITASGTGWAQTARPAPTPQAEPDPTTEIVVTAQRRAERLENVPMSVTAINSAIIERAGVSDLRDIGKIASGVQVNLSGAFTQPAIRGVTTLINGNGTENNVAIYVDGFYEPNTVAIGMELANLAGIEVLKGPQGTLYGRNATGGAILVNTLAPSATFTGKADISYATFDDKRASAFVSGPLSDAIRFSVAGSYRKRDGYLKLVDPNAAGQFVGHSNGVSQRAVRTKLEVDLTSNLVATLAYNYSYSNDTSGHVYTPYTYVPSFIPGPPRRATRLGEVSHDTDPKLANTTHQGTLKVRLDTGFGNVTTYTGYTSRKDRSVLDFDGTYSAISTLISDFDQDTWQHTVDVNVTSIDRLNLIVGGNYYHDYTRSPDDSGTLNLGTNNTLTAIAKAGSKTKAYSFYADATYSLTDALSLNVGGRYSHDVKTIDYRAQTGAGVVTFVPTHKEATFQKFTPRASIRYELAPRTNVYASISRGFRSGSYNLGGAGSPALLTNTKPETITAYEIGFKTARRLVRFDIAGFYYDYKDLQVSVALPNLNCPAGTTCVPIPQFANAPKAEIYGIDGKIDINPSSRLNFGIGAAWLHARYKDFATATGLGLNAATGLNVTQSQDWKGQQMARAPDFTVNVSSAYTVPVAGGALMLSSNLAFSDSYVISNPSLYGPLAGAFANKQRYRQEAFTLIGGNATWTDASKHFSLGVFGTNLTNKRYRVTYNGAALGDYSAMGMPRQIGVRAGYKF